MKNLASIFCVLLTGSLLSACAPEQARPRQQPIERREPAFAAAGGANAAPDPVPPVGVPVRRRAAPAARDPGRPQSWGKVGRNEPCPCGSGRKYKHCHGRIAQSG